MAANPLPLPGYIAATIPAKTDHVAGTTLFHLAMVEFGDPLLWVPIAQLNEMTDPWIFDLRDVLIPPVLPGVVRELPEIGGQPFVPPPPPLAFTPNPAFLGLAGGAGPLIAFSYVTGGLLLNLTGVAPTVVNSGSPRLAPASASPVLSGPAPTMLHSLSMTPASAALILTGQSSQTPLNRTPTVASLVLGATTPSRALSLGVQTASLTLTGPAPTIVLTHNPAFAPTAAALALTAAAPQSPVYTPWTGPTSGLTHRWQMDSGSISGTTISDLIGATDLISSGTVATVSSPPGAYAPTAISLDGSSGQLSTGGVNPISTGVPWTVGFWTLLPDITYHSGGSQQRFFNFTDSGTGWFAENFTTGFPGHICFGIGGGSTFNVNGITHAIYSNSAVLSNNTWAHVVLTYDGSTTMTLRVNGVLISGFSSAGSWGDVRTGTSNNAIGGDNSGSSGYCKGSFYQFVTYNRVLSGAEISTLYAAG